ncbi:MAG: hypothetical protein HKN24_08765 [Acidimicrobiales bacterium]|nr:hypothetical protein [Acidimicrobiales bacterium]
MTTAQKRSTFGVSLGEIARRGVGGFAKQPIPLLGAAAVTLGVYGLFRWPAQQLFDDDRVYQSVAVDLVGLVVAGTVAHPWYAYALDAARGDAVDVRGPLRSSRLYRTQLVSSFWFWAGVLLGLRYLAGLPSIVVMLFYAFHGYVIADRKLKSGMMALGTSVRLGQGRRIGLFALGGLLIVFNLFGAISLGFDVNPLTIALAIVGLAITTSITLVCGAVVYDALDAELDDEPPPPRPQARSRKSKKKGNQR